MRWTYRLQNPAVEGVFREHGETRSAKMRHLHTFGRVEAASQAKRFPCFRLPPSFLALSSASNSRTASRNRGTKRSRASSSPAARSTMHIARIRCSALIKAFGGIDAFRRPNVAPEIQHSSCRCWILGNLTAFSLRFDRNELRMGVK